jgi:hypothetical protein
MLEIGHTGRSPFTSPAACPPDDVAELDSGGTVSPTTIARASTIAATFSRNEAEAR